MSGQIVMGKVSGSSLVLAVGFSGGAGDIATLRIRFPDATIDFEQVPYSIPWPSHLER